MYIIFLYTEKNATVKLSEMADSDSTGSKEKQYVDIFVDNHAPAKDSKYARK